MKITLRLVIMFDENQLNKLNGFVFKFKLTDPKQTSS